MQNKVQFKLNVSLKILFAVIVIFIIIAGVIFIYSSKPIDSFADGYDCTWSCVAKNIESGVILGTCNNQRYYCGTSFNYYSLCPGFIEYKDASNVNISCSVVSDPKPTKTSNPINSVSNEPTINEPTITPTENSSEFPTIEPTVNNSNSQNNSKKKTPSPTNTATLIPFVPIQVSPTTQPTTDITIIEKLAFSGKIIAISDNSVDISCTRYYFDSSSHITQQLEVGTYVMGTAVIKDNNYFIDSISKIDNSNTVLELKGYVNKLFPHEIVINEFAIDISERSQFINQINEGDPVIANVYLHNGIMELQSISLHVPYFQGKITKISLMNEENEQLLYIGSETYKVTKNTIFNNDNILNYDQYVYGTINIDNEIIEITGIRPFPFDIFDGYRSQPELLYLIMLFGVIGIIVTIIFTIASAFSGKKYRKLLEERIELQNLEHDKNTTNSIQK